jgi:Tfp pilus assembly protein PilF
MHLKNMGGHLAEAEAKFREAIAADASCEPAHYGLAWVLALERKTAEASAEFQTVLGMTKNPTHKQEATKALKRLGG